MRIDIICILSTLFLAMSCRDSRERNIAELCASKGGIRVCESQELFTGVLVDVFSKTGQPAFRVEIKDGIPNGNWQSLGYQGEEIQTGTYEPLYGLSSPVESLRFSRASFITLTEGAVILKSLDLIVEDSSLVGLNLNVYKKYFEQQLLDLRLLGERERLDSIRCSTFEGDWFSPK